MAVNRLTAPDTRQRAPTDTDSATPHTETHAHTEKHTQTEMNAHPKVNPSKSTKVTSKSGTSCSVRFQVRASSIANFVGLFAGCAGVKNYVHYSRPHNCPSILNEFGNTIQNGRPNWRSRSNINNSWQGAKAGPDRSLRARRRKSASGSWKRLARRRARFWNPNTPCLPLARTCGRSCAASSKRCCVFLSRYVSRLCCPFVCAGLLVPGRPYVFETQACASHSLFLAGA